MKQPTYNLDEDIEILKSWAKDVFLFAEEVMGMQPAEPIDSLKGKEIHYTDARGVKRTTMLFNDKGRLMYHDLSFYKRSMFKNQDKEGFKTYNGNCYTWQQTVKLEAYNRAINTFGKDAYNLADRWITTRSGHGTGKTSSTCTVAYHFLICFQGSQIGMTSNTEQQVQDIFLKEMSKWKRRLPPSIGDGIDITSDHVRVEGSEDWFLRAQVARKEKPEALAGLHAEFVLILVDEASGIDDKVFEVMKGALTGDYFVVMYDSNPTRAEGEFFESHKPTSTFTKLHFSSRDSPIVKDGYIQKMEEDYPSNGEQHSDEVLIRVDGEFPSTTEMDDKGWIPLFSNVIIRFEAPAGQIINGGIIAVDPAGGGADRAIAGIRDNVYLKEVLNEPTSNPKDLARKVETIRDAYNCSSFDIGIEAFGVGAQLVANIETKFGEHVHALLTDKPREGTEKVFNSWKSEMGWLFRQWVLMGGIIITNNKSLWLKEMEKIMYKRDTQGRICLMGKVEFKKRYGFSPDRFDMGLHTFFKEQHTVSVSKTKQDIEREEMKEFINKASAGAVNANKSSM